MVRIFYSSLCRLKFSTICAVLLLAGTFVTQIQAQVTVAGALVGSGTYPDLGSAFTAINGGAQTGAIISITITANTTELATATLNQNTWFYLTISPSGGAARTISGNITGPLVDFNGADRVGIDGLNTGGNSLTFDNTATGASSTIRFINDARGIGIQNVTLKGSSTSTVSGTVFYSTGTVAGNDSIALQTCTIMESGVNLPVNAVYSAGTATSGVENSNNQILTSNIQNYFSAASVTNGILLSTGNTDWIVTGNRFYQTATRTYTTANTHAAIRISSGNNHTISGNTIGYATAGATGTYTISSTVATRFIGIDLSVGNVTASSVQGNTVTAIQLSTSSGATTTNGVLCGINVTGTGNVNIGTVTPNVIGASTGTGALTATPSTANGCIVGINSSSTGTINISNNVIGSFTSVASSLTLGGAVAGINISGATANLTIANNTIGNATADNMRSGNLGTTTGNSFAHGIHLASAPTLANITGNTIQNLSAYGTGTSTTLAYAQGIKTVAGGTVAAITISGNTISNIITSAGNPTVANGLTSAQGIMLSTGNFCVIEGNTIFNIRNINTAVVSTVVSGIGHGNAANTTIRRNVIYNLSNASTQTSATAPPVAVGVLVRSGTTAINIYNNMISLGTGETTNTCFVGIQGNHGSTPDPVVNSWYNTVNIEGTVAAGALSSFGYYRGDWSLTARTATHNVLNNILNNTRTGGTGSHYAISNNFGATTPSTTGWGTNASNYNVLNANAATIGHWTTAQTFAGWKAASNSDANSYSNIGVTFVSVPSNLHLNMGVTATSIESGGTTIGTVTTDIDAQVRPGPAGSVLGGAFAPDIGADEIDAVPLDQSAPNITFTALTGVCTTGDQIITATILDLTGVPTVGALVPRVYFRKNTGAWFSTAGVLTAGTATSGTWQFTISAAAMGGLVSGDLVSYYFIAQDIVAPTPNLGSNPAAGLVATDVNTVTTPPTSPYKFGAGPLTGTYTVGLTGNFITLTDAVLAYNTACLGGPVLFSLIDATYPSETFPITVLANATSSAVNTLTIKPAAGVNASISGSSPTLILNLSGADYVTVDGHNGTTVNSICPSVSASRNLTITNTSALTTSGVVGMLTAGTDPATRNTYQNCVVVGSGTAATLIGINLSGNAVGSGAGANGNHHNSVINNEVKKCQFGIFSASAAAPKNFGTTISQNVVTATAPDAVGRIGIMILNEDTVNVEANHIANITNTGLFDVGGIFLGYNAITNTSAGGSEVSNATVRYNKIDNITHTATFSAGGIAIASTVSGTTLVANNTVSQVWANGTAGDFAVGIFHGGGTGTFQCYHNSISLTGTLTGASQPSIGLGLNGTTPVVDVKNNIISVTGTSGFNGNTGIGLGYTSTLGAYVNLACNYNDIHVTGTSSCVGRTGGLAAGVARTTLLDWQTETGADLNSVTTAPVFASASDLHLNYASSAALSNLGTALPAITSDMDCDVRDASAPDMGADEFCSTAIGGVITPADTALCAGPISLLLADLGYSFASGSGYSWESGPFGAGTFAPTGGIDPNGENTGSVTVSTEYRLKVTCVTDGSTAYSDTMSIFIGDSINPDPLCNTISITLDPSGSFTIPDDTLDNGSSDNCSGTGDLTFAASQTTFGCADLGTVLVTLIVSDTSGNSDSCIATVNVSASTIVASVSADTLISGYHVACNGDSTGTATADITGGCPSYTYLWDNGDMTATTTTLSAGTHTVTVTDGSGQSDTLTVDITEPPALGATSTSTLESCDPGSDGCIDLSVSGGVPGYTYLWSTSATTEDICGLTAGSYDVTVTDTMGCTFTYSETVSPAPGPGAPVVTQSNDTLFSSITDPTYTYQWYFAGSPIAGATDPFVVATTDGSYMVYVTDTFGCVDSSMVYLYVAAAQASGHGALQLWPNPATGNTALMLSGATGNWNVRVTDMYGRVMYLREAVSLAQKHELDLRGWASGVYLTEVWKGNEHHVIRLVVE